MARSLRRYDTQATYALVLALVSIVPVAAAVLAVAMRYDPNLKAVQYGTSSLLMPALLACLGLGIITSALAIVLGINSAGQRRNDKQRRSWIGFFLGGAMLAVSLIVFAAFFLLGLAIG